MRAGLTGLPPLDSAPVHPDPLGEVFLRQPDRAADRAGDTSSSLRPPRRPRAPVTVLAEFLARRGHAVVRLLAAHHDDGTGHCAVCSA